MASSLQKFLSFHEFLFSLATGINPALFPHVSGKENIIIFTLPQKISKRRNCREIDSPAQRLGAIRVYILTLQENKKDLQASYLRQQQALFLEPLQILQQLFLDEVLLL